MKDLTNKIFGKLTVINRVLPNDKWNSSKWNCRCECGNYKVITLHGLSKGTKSCGCLHKQSISTHGLCSTRLYKTWESMKARCNSPRTTKYSYYGGRGITVCDKWSNNFMVFHDWALNNGYTDKLTIDRKDSNGNYEPANCKWSSRTEQQRNKRNSVYIEINGITKHLLEWAKEYNLKKQTIVTRYYKGTRGIDLIKPARITSRVY